MEQMKQKTEEINQLAKSMQENKGDASLMEEANISLNKRRGHAKYRKVLGKHKEDIR